MTMRSKSMAGVYCAPSRPVAPGARGARITAPSLPSPRSEGGGAKPRPVAPRSVPVVLALLPAACATGPRRPVALAVGGAVAGRPRGAYDSALDPSGPPAHAAARAGA